MGTVVPACRSPHVRCCVGTAPFCLLHYDPSKSSNLPLLLTMTLSSNSFFFLGAALPPITLLSL